MKIAVLGATGATGKYVVENALKAGDEVVAVVRSAAKLTTSHPKLDVVEAQLGETDKLAQAFAGVDAVVSTLGVARGSTEQPSRHLPQVLEAMRKAGVNRYVGVSGGGVDAPGDNKDFKGKFISFLVRKLSPHVFEDKQREVDLLSSQPDIEWELARAPRLVDGPTTGQYRVDARKMPGVKINRGDMADFLLKEAKSPTYPRAAPFISA